MDVIYGVIRFFGWQDPIELTAALFGFICVVLTIREHMACWPTGLVQVSLYVWVFYKARLYSDMGLHVVYILMSLYGWYHWLYGGRNKTEAPITLLTPGARTFWILLALTGSLSLGWFMRRYTNADLPYWDSAITAFSLCAQWLMAKKKLESWLFWILVDVLAVGVYYVKHLYPTTILYAIFLGLAATGFFSWLGAWRKKWQPA